MSRNETDRLCDALRLVPRRWQAAFAQFVAAGEADSAFFAFLNTNHECRRACEMVLRADATMVALVAAAVAVQGEHVDCDESEHVNE